MKKTAFIHVLIMLFFVILTSSNAFSVIFPKYCLEDLCDKSDTIITATVASINCFKHDEKIYTSIKFQTDENIKGDLNQTSTFEMTKYGGTIGNTTVAQAYAPKYTIGEEVMLFMKEYTSKKFGRNFSIIGLSEGKFTIKDGKIYRSCDVPLRVKSTFRLYDISNKQKSIDKNEIIDQVKTIVQ